MMKTVFMSACLLVASAPAFACQTYSAQVKGLVGGSRFDNGICYVTVFVEASKADPVCGLQLKKEQEVEVATKLSNKQCPQDEAVVTGRITALGSNRYILDGRIY